MLLVSKLWLFGKKYHTAVLRTFSMTSSMLRTDFVFFMAKVLQIAFSFGHKREIGKKVFTDPTTTVHRYSNSYCLPKNGIVNQT